MRPRVGDDAVHGRFNIDRQRAPPRKTLVELYACAEVEPGVRSLPIDADDKWSVNPRPCRDGGQ